MYDRYTLGKVLAKMNVSATTLEREVYTIQYNRQSSLVISNTTHLV